MGNKNISRVYLKYDDDIYYNINKYIINNNKNIIKTHNTIYFYRDFYFGSNKFIVFTVKLKFYKDKNKYATSLWILKYSEFTYTLYDIKYHSNKKYFENIFIEYYILAEILSKEY